MDKKLAIHGGQPVRAQDNPLPNAFPKGWAMAGLDNVTEAIKNDLRANYVAQFERVFAEMCGVKYSVSSTVCTTAVHAAMAAIEMNPGDEVLISPISDIGSMVGILYQNAIPVFPDVDVRTGNITGEDIEKKVTERTRAIVAVHLYGQPCDMDPVMEVAEKHNLIVVEDCCQAILAEYRGKKVGSIGHMGAFSFDYKHISTGHGGMILTNDEKWTEALTRLGQARGEVPRPKEGCPYRTATRLGHCFPLGVLDAALGLPQLKNLPWNVKRRMELANMLSKRLEEIDGVSGPYVIPEATHAYWLYPLRVDLEKLGVNIYTFSRALKAEGVNTVPKEYWLLYAHEFLANKRNAYGTSGCPFDCKYTTTTVEYGSGLCPNAEKFVAETTALDWCPYFTEEDIEDIAIAIEKVASYMIRQRKQ